MYLQGNPPHSSSEGDPMETLSSPVSVLDLLGISSRTSPVFDSDTFETPDSLTGVVVIDLDVEEIVL